MYILENTPIDPKVSVSSSCSITFCLIVFQYLFYNFESKLEWKYFKIYVMKVALFKIASVLKDTALKKKYMVFEL